MAADAVLGNAATRERTVPGRFNKPLPRVTSVADAACLAFGALHPNRPAAVDEGATMTAGLMWMEPALKRFIYRDLQEQSELDPKCPLSSCATYSFPWQGGDDVDFEDAAEKALSKDAVFVEHALALWVELRNRLGAA
eukprot:3851407-Prymnesium_polylepis.1